MRHDKRKNISAAILSVAKDLNLKYFIRPSLTRIVLHMPGVHGQTVDLKLKGDRYMANGELQ